MWLNKCLFLVWFRLVSFNHALWLIFRDDEAKIIGSVLSSIMESHFMGCMKGPIFRLKLVEYQLDGGIRVHIHLSPAEIKQMKFLVINYSRWIMTWQENCIFNISYVHFHFHDTECSATQKIEKEMSLVWELGIIRLSWSVMFLGNWIG